jgi:hypothetical protein
LGISSQANAARNAAPGKHCRADEPEKPDHFWTAL